MWHFWKVLGEKHEGVELEIKLFEGPELKICSTEQKHVQCLCSAKTMDTVKIPWRALELKYIGKRPFYDPEQYGSIR